MSEKSLIGDADYALKSALSLYVCSGNVLTEGTSFSVKLNNCALAVSVKNKTLTAEFKPDREAAGDTPYELNMTLGIYEEENDGIVINAAELMKQAREGGNNDREKAD